ncbi:bacillithiol system redox-active protein YtxJ [Flavobacterium sp.]|uniref:bacillithiol system redox-active protein YtxJ n=1 Tax=Flavobacterium sp. TaxID=239 RepID=UPI00262AE298|nr:bacillithiol system redox-active protein YtxJ [Flavobacterium sp.]
MSLFKNIFGSSDEENLNSRRKLDWVAFEHIDQLDMIIQNSWQKPVLIFKHSTRCIISKTALSSFENEFHYEDKITLYFLDLLKYRTISNEVAETFVITHQSPQILLIKNGIVIYDASHESIDAAFLERFVND